ncbi:MAG: CvpA family protein [Chthoniobacterales bacterium]
MTLAENTFAGLTVLQIALVSLTLLIITMNVWSGWQNGIVRQVLRIFAILAGYIAGYKLGPVLTPMVPDVAVLGSVQPAVISLLTGFLTYLFLRFLINMLFRKTREQESAIMRFIYGIGGATIGLFFSVFFLVVFLAGIRLLGTVVDAQFHVAEKRHEKLPDDTRTTVMTQFSKARQAIENGPVAAVVETIDPTPTTVYKTLDRVTTMTADPDAMNRFFNYPGTKKLMQHPALKKLADDPQVQVMVQKKDYVGLMQNPKVAEMLKDDSLRTQLKTFEFNKALDYSLKPGPIAPAKPSPTPLNTILY